MSLLYLTGKIGDVISFLYFLMRYTEKQYIKVGSTADSPELDSTKDTKIYYIIKIIYK